jgi:hypothetical protein
VKVPSARLARLLLIALLLAAQQSAIAHGVWHFAGGAKSQHSGSGGSTLCDQHSALGTVLGALGSAAAAPPPASQRAGAIASERHANAPAAALAASSRDPPALP